MWETSFKPLDSNSVQAASAPEAALSVSAALDLAKNELEKLNLVIRGEVSELSDKPGYKAAYFTLRDESSSLSCMMWKSLYEANGIKLKPGMLVDIRGSFSLYKAKGSMQFSVKSIRPVGEGDLRQKVALLAEKLRKEGLMSEQRKKRPQSFCQRVALITSPRGKAVHDVLRTLKRRNPLVEISFFGVPVEGAGAAQAMISALVKADNLGLDAILLVRGGGAYEDFMPFNDERLARCLAACKTPTVTGIGHEPDNCICDMVADKRCSTPTAAAESLAPSIQDLEQDLDGSYRRLGLALKTLIERRKEKLKQLEKGTCFISPQNKLKAVYLELDQAQERLSRVLPLKIDRMQAQFSSHSTALMSLSNRFMLLHQKGLAVQAARLDNLSPLKLLSRGYAYVKSDEGKIVDSVDSLKPGDNLSISLKDGQALVCVEELISKGERE